VHASRLPSIDLRRFADQISNRHLSALSSMSLLFGNLLLNVSGIVPPSVRGMIFHWLVPMKTMISVTTAAHAKLAERQMLN
jgi:hypothetical protein